MALTPSQKRRQRELYSQGYTGRTDAELHSLNVQENAGKTPGEMRREIAERLAQGEPVTKLVRALENSGEHD